VQKPFVVHPQSCVSNDVVLILFVCVLQMSAAAKLQKFVAQLQQAETDKEAAIEEQKRKAQQEEISNPAVKSLKQLKKRAPARCKRCHLVAKDNCRILNAKTGKYEHDCIRRYKAPCTNFAACGYQAGHPREATAARRVNKLKLQAEEAEKAAQAEVCFSFGLLR
jgi:serine/threonine-protein kinase RIO1